MTAGHISANDRLVKMIDGGVHVSVKGQCNMRCLFCNLAGDAPAVEADGHLRQLKSAIDGLAERGTRSIAYGVFHYEPTTFEHLPRLVAHARARGIRDQQLVTNGVRTADAAYLRELVDAGLTNVNVSLFEWDELSADVIGGAEGVLAARLATLEQCRALGVSTSASLLLMRANYQRVGDVLRLFGGFFESLPVYSVQPAMGERTAWFLPPLTGLVRAVAAAIREGPAPKLRLHAVPVCLRGPLEGISGVTFIGDEANEDPARCGECDRSGSCPGLSEAYVEVYGAREITERAVIESPIALDELERLCDGAVSTWLSAEGRRGASRAAIHAAIGLADVVRERLSATPVPGFRLGDVSVPHQDRVQVVLHHPRADVRLLLAPSRSVEHAFVRAGGIAIMLPKGPSRGAAGVLAQDAARRLAAALARG